MDDAYVFVWRNSVQSVGSSSLLARYWTVLDVGLQATHCFAKQLVAGQRQHGNRRQEM